MEGASVSLVICAASFPIGAGGCEAKVGTGGNGMDGGPKLAGSNWAMTLLYWMWYAMNWSTWLSKRLNRCYSWFNCSTTGKADGGGRRGHLEGFELGPTPPSLLWRPDVKIWSINGLAPNSSPPIGKRMPTSLQSAVIRDGSGNPPDVEPRYAYLIDCWISRPTSMDFPLRMAYKRTVWSLVTLLKWVTGINFALKKYDQALVCLSKALPMNDTSTPSLSLHSVLEPTRNLSTSSQSKCSSRYSEYSSSSIS